MNLFDIYVDSSANIPDELVKKYDIRVISYTCTVNGAERLCYNAEENFSDTAKKFYDEMRAGADVKTSLVGAERFINAIAPTLESGRDAVLITITSGMSGTHNEALKAKKELEEKYSSRLYVCDSANASMGQGLLALRVADLRAMGESAETCAEWVTNNAYKINSLVTVGDLKYLRKGGRVSALAAIAGTILNIKPILWANDTKPAKLAMWGKERGRKKALQTIAQEFAKRVTEPENQTVAITHADCEEDALYLAGLIKEYGVKDLIIEYYDICTGIHAGPGTVALFFYGKDRITDVATSPFKKKLSSPAVQKI